MLSIYFIAWIMFFRTATASSEQTPNLVNVRSKRAASTISLVQLLMQQAFDNGTFDLTVSNSAHLQCVYEN